MKHGFILFSFCLVLSACSDAGKDAAPASENEIDAARNFIRASLDGEFDKAKSYMLHDETNEQGLEQMELLIQKSRDTEEKAAYRNADIRIFNSRKLNDSTYVVTYANTYKNKKDSLKLVRVQREWLVDFKYTFLNNGTAPDVR